MPLNIAMQKNIGAFITPRAAVTPTSITAGGGGDATEIDGEIIDRLVQGAGGPLLSAKVVMFYTATLAQDATLTLVSNVRDDDDSGMAGTPADLDDAFASAVVATGGAGGSTEVGVASYDVNLAGARRYVQVQMTPNLSAANTDTAIVGAVIILGGTDDYPAA